MARTAFLVPALLGVAVGFGDSTLVGVAEAQAQARPAENLDRSPNLGQFRLKPDITVDAVGIGKPSPGGVFDPLGHSPQVGEEFTLICAIGIAGALDRNAFKIAFYIDGQKTCGEGTEVMLNPPVCEYTWPLSVGAKAVLSYISHTPGRHTYRCAAGIRDQVTEHTEGNNSKEVAFTTLWTAVPIVRDRKAIGHPLPDPGPRLIRH